VEEFKIILLSRLSSVFYSITYPCNREGLSELHGTTGALVSAMKTTAFAVSYYKKRLRSFSKVFGYCDSDKFGGRNHTLVAERFSRRTTIINNFNIHNQATDQCRRCHCEISVTTILHIIPQRCLIRSFIHNASIIYDFRPLLLDRRLCRGLDVSVLCEVLFALSSRFL